MMRAAAAPRVDASLIDAKAFIVRPSQVIAVRARYGMRGVHDQRVHLLHRGHELDASHRAIPGRRIFGVASRGTDRAIAAKIVSA
jgi:hypothetical protein